MVEALQQALDAARARAGAERLSDVEGVLGTLLDLVEIDDGWEPAVEAALGEALTAVVVDSGESARRALAALRDSDLSGAVLAAGSRGPASPVPPVGVAVRPHVRSGRPGLSSLLDALIGGFPAGTVSGAPKVRAMEIIEELEPFRRGIYAGAVGYFDLQGSMDFCITIRTIVMRNGEAVIQAGAGIVADSDPEKEWDEIRSKTRILFRAIGVDEEGERA